MKCQEQPHHSLSNSVSACYNCGLQALALVGNGIPEFAATNEFDARGLKVLKGYFFRIFTIISESYCLCLSRLVRLMPDKGAKEGLQASVNTLEQRLLGRALCFELARDGLIWFPQKKAKKFPSSFMWSCWGFRHKVRAFQALCNALT